MILVRLINNIEPEIIMDDTEENIINKIHSLKLCDWHDAFFYERGKFEKLGLGSSEYDYYVIYTDREEMYRIQNSRFAGGLLKNYQQTQTI